MIEGEPAFVAAHRLPDGGRDGALLCDGRGRIVFLNDVAARCLGRAREDVPRNFPDRVMVHSETLGVVPLSALVADVARKGGARRALRDRITLARPDGARIAVALQIYPLGAPARQSRGALVILRDPADPETGGSPTLDGESYHRGLAHISGVITRTLDTSETVRAVVEALLEIYGADRAWLIHPCDPTAPSWTVHVEAARAEYPGMFAEGRSVPMDPTVASIMRRALESAGPLVCDSAESELEPALVRRFSIRSQMMVALHPRLGHPWLLGMHQCTHPRRWTVAERNLLQDIGQRLTDALTNQMLFHRLEEDVRRREAVEAALTDALEEHRRLIDATPDIVFRTDPDGRLVHWNRSLEGFTGRDATALKAMAIRELFAPQERAALESLLRGALEAGRAAAEVSLADRSGAAVPYHWVAVALKGRAGEATGITGFGRDITEQKRAAEGLSQAAAVFENSSDAIVIADAHLRIVRVNGAFNRVTGFEGATAVGAVPGLFALEDGSDAGGLWERVNSEGSWRGEVLACRVGGERFPARLAIDAVRDAAGLTTSYVLTFADITELRRSQRRLQHLAQHDPLTGLPNRMMCSMHLERVLHAAERDGSGFALMFVDLDGFKEVNDRFGHHVGDRVLKEVAARLANNVRERGDERVFRLGGDEFVVVLEGIRAAEEIRGVARRVLDLMSAPFVVQGRRIRLSASVGACRCPDDAREVGALLRFADAAMYRVKRNGGDGYGLFGTAGSGAGR